MGSTPISVITIGFSGFPYLALVRAALSSPIREASLFTCNAITLENMEESPCTLTRKETGLKIRAGMPACALHSTHTQIHAVRPTGSTSTWHRQQSHCLKLCKDRVACKSYPWDG